MNIEDVKLMPESIRIIQDARKRAVEMENHFVGTEHLLLALIDSTEAVSEFMKYIPFDTEKIRELVLVQISHNTINPLLHYSPLTPRVKKVIVLSNRIAKREFDASHVSPVHLLLGLLQEGDGVAGRVLKACGLTYEDALSRFPGSRTNSAKKEKTQSPEIGPIQIAKTETLDCKNGYVLDIKVLRVPTTPTTHIFSLDLNNKETTWQEAFTTEAEINAFIRGLSAGVSMYGHVLPLPRLKFILH